MITRAHLPLLLALAAACGGGAATSGGGSSASVPEVRHGLLQFRAGGPWRYEFLNADTLITTLPNGQLQQQRVERRVHFRWAAAPNGAALALTLTVDSIRVVGMGRGPEDSARGAVITATLDPAGRLTEVRTTSPSGLVRTFVAQLGWIIPRLPNPGGQVEDTITSTVPFGVVDLAEQTVRRTANGTVDGVMELSGAVTRDGVTPELRFTGSGTRSGRATLTPTGLLQTASGRDSLAMVATVASMGQSVRILQVGNYTLTLLP